MDLILQTALRFPLVVFTLLLALILLYWCLVVVGVAPVELFEHDSLKQEHLPSTMVSLGFAGIPATVALTVLTMLAGGITLAVELLVLRWLPLGLFRIPVGVAVLWGSFVLASPLAAMLCHALHRWFHRHSTCHRYLLGETVQVEHRPDREGHTDAVLVDDPDFVVKLHGKPDAMPEMHERRVLVKYLPEEGAYRSVAEAEYLEARTRLSRLRLLHKHRGQEGARRNGGPAASL